MERSDEDMMMKNMPHGHGNMKHENETAHTHENMKKREIEEGVDS